MAKPEEIVSSLEQSVTTLLRQYADLQQQVSTLTEANNNLRNELINSHAEIKELRDKYNTLQTAHALTSDSPERDKARRTITSIINKVDETILLLGE